MRVSTAQMYRQGVQSMLQQQDALARTQLQVASGKRILAPADDPAGAKQLLDIEQSLGLTRQYLRNADTHENQEHRVQRNGNSQGLKHGRNRIRCSRRRRSLNAYQRQERQQKS